MCQIWPSSSKAMSTGAPIVQSGHICSIAVFDSQRQRYTDQTEIWCRIAYHRFTLSPEFGPDGSLNTQKVVVKFTFSGSFSPRKMNRLLSSPLYSLPRPFPSLCSLPFLLSPFFLSSSFPSHFFSSPLLSLIPHFLLTLSSLSLFLTFPFLPLPPSDPFR